MSMVLDPISYKDAAGYVVKREDGYYRYVTYTYAREYLHLTVSGLYQRLVTENLLLPHREIEDKEQNNSYYKLLYPQQIPLITYPFGWTYSQWQEMVLTYIRINEIALQYGMILKDATPYNFVFFKGSCILMDTLSFNFYTDKSPWLAYRQFCEEIFSPLALMRYNDPLWIKLYQSAITGLPLAFISKQLPLRTWFNSSCLLHIHIHAKFQNKKGKSNHSDSSFNKEKLITLLQLLKNTVTAWNQPLHAHSIWDKYYQEGIEEERYLADKLNCIIQWLSEIKPTVTIDLGANTGKFSFIAASFSKQVVAIERDMLCVEEIRRQSKQNKHTNITTIVADITEPSPGLGWENAEKTALLKRLNGNLVLVLALIHHLCLGKNIPLIFAAKLIASITTQFAIVEFIPIEDPKAKLLLQYREDIFKTYTEEHFVTCFQKYFKLLKVHDCKASARKLYLWEKN